MTGITLYRPAITIQSIRTTTENAEHDLAVLEQYYATRKLPATTHGRTTLTAPRILPSDWTVTLRRVREHRETGREP